MRVGPYELLERLGQGGMGEVWRARHVELGAVRALKRTLRKDAQLAARFEREARARSRSSGSPGTSSMASQAVPSGSRPTSCTATTDG